MLSKFCIRLHRNHSGSKRALRRSWRLVLIFWIRRVFASSSGSTTHHKRSKGTTSAIERKLSITDSDGELKKSGIDRIRYRQLSLKRRDLAAISSGCNRSKFCLELKIVKITDFVFTFSKTHQLNLAYFQKFFISMINKKKQKINRKKTFLILKFSRVQKLRRLLKFRHSRLGQRENALNLQSKWLRFRRLCRLRPNQSNLPRLLRRQSPHDDFLRRRLLQHRRRARNRRNFYLLSRRRILHDRLFDRLDKRRQLYASFPVESFEVCDL